MPNKPGFPYWYELMSAAPEAATAFYEKVVGWKVGAPMGGEIDYRTIAAGDGNVGGLLGLTEEMKAGGARPNWVLYLYVDDVDATADRIGAAGGGVLKPAWDLAGAGRLAMVADPQGMPFYIMRGDGAESSAFDRTGMGKCNWNELATPDQAGAHAFYADLFGWRFPDKLAMGEMGDYVFVEASGETIGGTMPSQPGAPSGWRFYFRVPDIDAGIARVKAAGGTVHHGPVEVAGGERVILASDIEGAPFGLVGPARTGEK